MADAETMDFQNGIMNEKEWKAFIETDGVNFVMKYNLQSLTVDDGAGKKGKIKRNSEGGYVTDVTIRNVL